MRRKTSQSPLCRYASGGTSMTDSRARGALPPFVVRDDFLETAFELRFQGLLRQAWQEHTWHVIAALPGSGKSLGIADLTHQSNACKASPGATYLPLLAIRAPKNGGTDLALGTAFCTIFGIVPAMPWYVRRAWLVQAMAEAGGEFILLSDPHALNLAHLAVLKQLAAKMVAPPVARQSQLLLGAATSGQG